MKVPLFRLKLTHRNREKPLYLQVQFHALKPGEIANVTFTEEARRGSAGNAAVMEKIIELLDRGTAEAGGEIPDRDQIQLVPVPESELRELEIEQEKLLQDARDEIAREEGELFRCQFKQPDGRWLYLASYGEKKPVTEDVKMALVATEPQWHECWDKADAMCAVLGQAKRSRDTMRLVPLKEAK